MAAAAPEPVEMVAAPQSQQMVDGGPMGNHSALLQNIQVMDINQTRRGCLKECLCPCMETKTEFHFFDATSHQHIATTLEDSECLHRWCCAPLLHPYKMVVMTRTDPPEEILTATRPWGGWGTAACKLSSCAHNPCCWCCCNVQEIQVTRQGQALGSVRDTTTWHCCTIPNYTVKDADGTSLYKIQQPTCLGGLCVHPCAEGCHCCTYAVPFWVMGPEAGRDTNQEKMQGKILRKPMAFSKEIGSDADNFEVMFPHEAPPEHKALLMSAALLLNSLYFEGGQDNENK